MRRSKDEISAQDALRREATQDRAAETLRTLHQNARKALSLSLAARFAREAERDDVTTENTFFATLDGARELAALVDTERGGNKNDYTEAIRTLTERLKRGVERQTYDPDIQS